MAITQLFSQLQRSLKISGKGVTKKDGSGAEGVVEEGGMAGSTKEKLNGFSFKSST